jgi:hypothetical protein
MTELNKYSKNQYPQADNWSQAFAHLKNYLSRLRTTRKKIVFIDNIHFLDSRKSGFLHAFESWCNSYASINNDVFLVACASSPSWLINKIFENRGGLGSRITNLMPLKAFSLKEVEQFFKSKKIKLSRIEIAETYMIMGGIPYYLEKFKKQYSLDQNIDDLFFKKNAILKDEFYRLYNSLFNKPEKYIKIIDVLAKKIKGFVKIRVK